MEVASSRATNWTLTDGKHFEAKLKREMWIPVSESSGGDILLFVSHK